jgi:hypothetical protein
MHILSKALIGLVATRSAHAWPLDCNTTSIAQPVPTANPNTQPYQDQLSTSSAIKKLQRLLVKDDAILTGDALRERVVFDFNGAQPADGAKGGATKAAVSV